MLLHNRVNGRELKERIRQSNESRTTISFYKYFTISNPTEFRDTLYKDLIALHVLGRVYVAQEGINAQISVPTADVDSLVQYLNTYPALANIRLNKAIEDNGKSFFKLKILVRKKIVADGLDDATFDVSNGGQHLNAKEFNEYMDKDGTVVVDLRNHYESEVGHFENALCPDVTTFRDELRVVETILQEDKDKTVLLYCTGGIRCEKASAWFKHKGFQNVYQLNGGIIEYARQVREQGLTNKFLGKNFVFDERMGERISPDIISVCHQCGKPCDDHVNCLNEACHTLFIQCAECKEKYETCCSLECRDINRLPLEQQKELRKGKLNSHSIFRKGKSDKLPFQKKSNPISI